MNPWHSFSDERIKKENFIAVIEIPKGSKNKYELDTESGMLRLDRILYTSTRYPANYGFIPRTLSEDGDPLDVLVLCGESMYPATLVTCEPIGVIKMVDGGSLDEKIIAVPVGDPTYKDYYDIKELPKHVFDEMMHFFEVYKTLEHKQTTVKEICHRDEAMDIIAKCIKAYDEAFSK